MQITCPASSVGGDAAGCDRPGARQYPRILLAAEPAGNPGSVTAEGIYRISDLLHTRGITVIVVTHNPELARRAGRVIPLRDGCVVKTDHRS